ICDQKGVLLMLDEVQTGMGRTGKRIAYQHSGIVPDVLTCAKALAGGIAAAVMMARPSVAASLVPGMHAATFGGSAIACSAGIDVIETIDSDGLLERGQEVGARFKAHLETLRAELPSLIRAVRVLGVMIGFDLPFDASNLVGECLKRKLLINATHGHVVRLLPALTITDEQIDEGCAILGDVLRSR